MRVSSHLLNGLSRVGPALHAPPLELQRVDSPAAQFALGDLAGGHAHLFRQVTLGQARGFAHLAEQLA